jgi:hypothetical protein
MPIIIDDLSLLMHAKNSVQLSQGDKSPDCSEMGTVKKSA